MAEVAERTIDQKRLRLLAPEVELQGWWTSLELPSEEVVKLYKGHGTHEQSQPEIKTDLDLERLPPGKFDTNDAVLHLGGFAYNYLRLLWQLGLGGKITTLRHTARRRRIGTVLQDIMCRAAKVAWQARQLVLNFGRGVAAHTQVFIEPHARMARTCGP